MLYVLVLCGMRAGLLGLYFVGLDVLLTGFCDRNW